MKSVRIHFQVTTLLMLAVLCLSTLGCQFAPKKLSDSWKWGEEEKLPVPDRILAVWTDTVLHQPNQPGVRGFGGRIFFYLKDQTDPIKVDGRLAVYVFDAEDADPMNQKPLRKYLFTAEQFASHMSKTSIGPSYSVWLPWGEVGGPQMKLSIIARFEGVEGGTTISDPTIKLLPGIVKRDASDEKPKGATATTGGAKGKITDSSGTSVAIAESNKGTVNGVERASFTQVTNSDPRESVDGASSTALAQDVGMREMSEVNFSRASGPAKDLRSVQTIDLPPAFERHFQRSSEVKTEVIDARSGNLRAFQEAYAGERSEPKVLRRSPANRLQVLRSGKWIDSVDRANGKRSQPVLNGVEMESTQESKATENP